MIGQNVAFDIFICKALDQLRHDVRGRSSAAQELSQACKDLTANGASAIQKENIATPLSPELAERILKPLLLASALDQELLHTTCLGIIHKLVSQAWLQGETSAKGSLEDGSMVCRTVKVILRCAESIAVPTHLSIIRALLTITTSDHFIVHGEALVQCFQVIFNLAIATEDRTVGLTAQNALLQMCNTVIRRTVHTSLSASTPRGSPQTPAYKTGHAVPRHLSTQSPNPAAAALGPPDNEAEGVAQTPELMGSLKAQNSTITTTRTAQLYALGEQCDLHGLESAMEGIPSRHSGPAPLATTSMAAPTAGAVLDAPSTPPQAPSVPDQPADGGKNGTSASGAARLASSSHGSTKKVPNIDVLEADMVVLLVALCRLAARQTTAVRGQENVYVTAGKFLASDILLRVLESSQNPWQGISSCAWSMLQQPLCITLLRSADVASEDSYSHGPRLFVALLTATPLRHSLKAELGAFFPLLLHKPLQMTAPRVATLAAALKASASLATNTQLLVELFVNYDCNLKAVNVVERWIAGLRRVSLTTDIEKSSAAITCVCAMLRGLADWVAALQGGASERAEEGGDGTKRLADEQVLEFEVCLSFVSAVFGSFVGCVVADNQGSTISGGNHVRLRDAVQARGLGRGPAVWRLRERAEEGGDGTKRLADEQALEVEAIKEMKDKRAAGLLIFENKPLKGLQLLQKGGIVGPTAGEAASWLRRNIHALNRDAVGELFGMEDKDAVAIMHAYIDLEEYADMRIDEALRKLLREFKLPGEAQQIDRIMEKFAEAYCKHNPGVFTAAEDAYRLAFAIIMLNTDVHNPLADHMLSKQTFVDMNSDVDEDGKAVPALPVDELHCIFDRVSAQEIQLLGRPTQPSTPRGREHTSTRRRLLNPARLAAALGVGSLLGSLQPQQMGRGNAENASSNPRVKVAWSMDARWHSVSNAQPARSILQVSSASLEETLKEGLRRSATFFAALQAARDLVYMTGTLGMHALCEDFVSMLCIASGVYSPAPPHSPEEGRQLQALRALVDTALGFEAEHLGSAWWLVLRAMSVLEAMLDHDRTLRASRNSTSLPSSPSTSAASPRAPANAPVLSSVEAGVRYALSSLLGETSAPAHRTLHRSGSVLSSSRRLSAAPGAAQLAWARSPEGSAQLEAIYARSAALDGEAVVLFVRSLCAISTQELQPLAGVPPRVTSLHHLMEVLLLNMFRIRLIWSRLWAVAAPHFVAAACHEDVDIAMVAVNALKQLVGRLLARTELEHFQWQEQALRPFVQILRHAGDPEVRSLAISCVQQLLQTVPHQLISGWSRLLEAIEVAVLDPKLIMLVHAQAILPQAIAAAEGTEAFLLLLPQLLGLCALAATHEWHPHLCFAGLKCLQQIIEALRNREIGKQDSNGLLQQQESGASGRDGNGSVAPSLCSDNPPPISTPANATLKGRMPWLFEPGAAEQPWPLVVHAYAHIALCARNDVVAEQAVEEAMRTLHRHVGWWDATTLVATLSCVHETLFAGSHVSCMSSGQPVPLSGVELSRLLSRFQTYLPSLWTLVIAEYGTLGVRGFQKILESPLVLMHLPSVDAMASGVTALHQLGVVLAGQGAAALDEAGWAALAATLRAACSLDSVAVLPAAQRFETVICAQRLSVEMVSHSGRCMPSSFLGGIRETVDRAADVAGSQERLSPLAHELAAAPSGGTLGNSGGGHNEPPQPATPPQHSDSKDQPRTPPHVRQSVAQWADATKLLRKQQNHGSHCLVKAYLSLMQSHGPSPVRDFTQACADKASAVGNSVLADAQGSAEEAQRQLLSFCREVISECAAVPLRPATPRTEGVDSPAAQLCAGVDGGGSADTGSVATPPAQPIRTRIEADLERLKQVAAAGVRGSMKREGGDSAPTSARSGDMDASAVDVLRWSVRENSAVVCLALRVLMEHAKGSDWVQQLMPSLCVLMKCGDRTVRGSIADVLESVVWPRLEHAL